MSEYNSCNLAVRSILYAAPEPSFIQLGGKGMGSSLPFVRILTDICSPVVDISLGL